MWFSRDGTKSRPWMNKIAAISLHCDFYQSIYTLKTNCNINFSHHQSWFLSSSLKVTDGAALPRQLGSVPKAWWDILMQWLGYLIHADIESCCCIKFPSSGCRRCCYSVVIVRSYLKEGLSVVYTNSTIACDGFCRDCPYIQLTDLSGIHLNYCMLWPLPIHLVGIFKRLLQNRDKPWPSFWITFTGSLQSARKPLWIFWNLSSMWAHGSNLFGCAFISEVIVFYVVIVTGIGKQDLYRIVTIGIFEKLIYGKSPVDDNARVCNYYLDYVVCFYNETKFGVKFVFASFEMLKQNFFKVFSTKLIYVIFHSWEFYEKVYYTPIHLVESVKVKTCAWEWKRW